ncbi:hypothetical protein NAEGRDRAFT_79246 [Naegleria gruberi]|uniref:VHS domain-containing protein n=1 Tax=Naegleria gruberi TaxID=5762 RepID=D2VAT6_NAEGR|nr:uncharacterized protein NAEGRDRAFT_79246 [Naegleria gruberi]EFC46006.1 hypothetical protein NAEGRDRAFT_79246 [Naegleria gruberi]|eukprot:XP_002678750.1 hypothetical protein NAEGRDRAFT_79246 [Naegleria gruberi strain NEG-M]
MIRRRVSDQSSSSSGASPSSSKTRQHQLLNNITLPNTNTSNSVLPSTSASVGSTAESTAKINEKTKYELSTLLHKHCSKDADAYVEDAILHKFKSILKQGDVYVETAYHQLIKSILTKKNSTIRYFALTFIHEAMRSKRFRTLLAQDFKEFIILTVAGSPASRTDAATSNVSSGKDNAFLTRKNSKYSAICVPDVLPPPEKSAMKLRAKALEYIENWSETYGQLYPSFQKGYEYIEKKLRFQFPKLREHHLNQVQIRNERQRHRQTILLGKFKNIKDNDFEKMAHIEVCLRQLEVCLEQIIPSFEEMMKIAIREDESVNPPVTIDPNFNYIETINSTSDENITEQNNVQNDNYNVNMDNYEITAEENEEDEWEEVTGYQEEEDENSVPLDIDDMMKDVGIFSNDYEITIDLKDIFQDQETIDNTTLFEICKENLRTLRKTYFPQIKEWMRIMTAIKRTR